MLMFLNGVIAMGLFVAGLFFLKFWRGSKDRLFLTFGLAFWIFAINYAVLGLAAFADEQRPYVFLLRLVGFVAILWGVADKNWNSRRAKFPPKSEA